MLKVQFVYRDYFHIDMNVKIWGMFVQNFAKFKDPKGIAYCKKFQEFSNCTVNNSDTYIIENKRVRLVFNII